MYLIFFEFIFFEFMYLLFFEFVYLLYIIPSCYDLFYDLMVFIKVTKYINSIHNFNKYIN